jgi:hypothetical protein
MSAGAPRSKTPVGAAVPAIEPNENAERTDPQMAPSVWATPAQPTPPDFVRSRKETLVSPIPALLAAQMADIWEDRALATPRPVDIREDTTSRSAVAGAGDDALIRAEEPEDYLVEVVGSANGGGSDQ